MKLLTVWIVSIALTCVAAHGFVTYMNSRPANKEQLSHTYTMVTSRYEELYRLLKWCLLDDVLTYAEYVRIREAYDYMEREDQANVLKELI